jgi:hypothetical protein
LARTAGLASLLILQIASFGSTTDPVYAQDAVNNPPLASAGPDQTVDEGAFVTLDGTNSSDADGNELSFSWIQIDGLNVELLDADTANPKFIAPSVDATTTIRFMLIVNDGILDSQPDIVSVNVDNAEENLGSLEVDVESDEIGATAFSPINNLSVEYHK